MFISNLGLFWWAETRMDKETNPEAMSHNIQI
jgi:hypothetical protein